MAKLRYGGGSLAALLALVTACGLETGGAGHELNLGGDSGAGSPNSVGGGGGTGPDAGAPPADSGSDSGHPKPDASSTDAQTPPPDGGDDAACASAGCPCPGNDEAACFEPNEVCLNGTCTACGALGTDQLECHDANTCAELLSTCVFKPGD